MQVNQPQGGSAEASTPVADLRLVSVQQLQKIHRDLDACQKVIWLAGVKPRGYGFDPSYVTDAQARLKEIETLLTAQDAPSKWTHEKPTQPGAYWIRGNLLREDALVQVRAMGSVLCCNLHQVNSDPGFEFGFTIEQLSEDFEWLGPLTLMGGN